MGALVVIAAAGVGAWKLWRAAQIDVSADDDARPRKHRLILGGVALGAFGLAALAWQAEA